jgi:curli biogenesis system outer membrane secretion channel CsgG
MRPKSFLPALMVTFFLIFSFLQRAEAGIKRIAVLDFEDSSVTTSQTQQVIVTQGGMMSQQMERGKVGRAVSDMLITELVKDGTFKIIERSQLEKVLSEQKLSISGVVDPSDVAKLGKVLGVSAVIVGSVTQFGIDRQTIGLFGIGIKKSTAKVAINARMIDTTSGEIFLAAEGAGDEEASGVNVGDYINVDSASFANSILGVATKKALKDIVKQIREQSAKLKESAITAYVAMCDIKANAFIIDIGKESGIENDQTLYVIKVLKEVKSPKTGEVIKRITDVIAELRITEIDKTSATATCVSGKCNIIKEGDMVSTSSGKETKEQLAKLQKAAINASVAYVEPSNKTIIFDAGKDQGVEKDQMFYVIKVTKEIKSPTTGEIIKRITDVVAEFKVTEVDKSSSIAAFVSGGFENIKEGDKISSSK